MDTVLTSPAKDIDVSELCLSDESCLTFHSQGIKSFCHVSLSRGKRHSVSIAKLLYSLAILVKDKSRESTLLTTPVFCFLKGSPKVPFWSGVRGHEM